MLGWRKGIMSKKKKIIIVSIGAVVILILVSFTNVVGIQSATSESVNDSPLFSIRTNTATNNEKNRVITFDYLGKGLNAIPFPLRDNRTALLQKVIGIIQKMDDKKFNRFQSLILSRFYKEIPKELDINQFDIIKLSRINHIIFS
jgi:hypothetical protein